MFEVNLTPALTIPQSNLGLVLREESLLLDSKRLSRKVGIDAAERMCGRNLPTDARRAISKLFTHPDDIMSKNLWVLMFRFGGLDTEKADFVSEFARKRLEHWGEFSRSGKLEAKPGALKLLNSVRSRKCFAALFTRMPKILVEQSLRHVLHAEDLFGSERLLCADDYRIPGQGSPLSRGWKVLAELAHDLGIPADQLVAVEACASGAKGALLAGYGQVVVVPEQTDAPLKYWDRQGLIEELLSDCPEFGQRLIFLQSLEHLRWSE